MELPLSGFLTMWKVEGPTLIWSDLVSGSELIFRHSMAVAVTEFYCFYFLHGQAPNRMGKAGPTDLHRLKSRI